MNLSRRFDEQGRYCLYDATGKIVGRYRSAIEAERGEYLYQAELRVRMWTESWLAHLLRRMLHEEFGLGKHECYRIMRRVLGKLRSLEDPRQLTCSV